jgi:predicted N-acetyltransferase YhbS
MYTISRANLEDAPTMLDLQRRAFAEEGRRSGSQDIPPLAEVLDAVIEHIQNQTALVARDNGKVIGTIRGIVKGHVCTVRALAVDPANQGHGVGSSLLDALEGTLPNVAQFDLTTNTVMEGNVPFYERHGYRVHELTRHSELVTLAQMTKVVDGDKRVPHAKKRGGHA